MDRHPPSGKKHDGFHGSGSIHQAPISLCSVSSSVCLWRSIVRTILGGNWTFGKLWVKGTRFHINFSKYENFTIIYFRFLLLPWMVHPLTGG